MKKILSTTQRGFTLFIAMILTSVILAVGLTLLDVAYKQVLLTSSAKQSTIAFYNADGGLECALLEDSNDVFDYYSGNPALPFTCQASSITWNSSGGGGTADRVITFNIPCTSGGYNAAVTIVKKSTGQTQIYSNGYNSCTATDPNRTERGIEAKY